MVICPFQQAVPACRLFLLTIDLLHNASSLSHHPCSSLNVLYKNETMSCADFTGGKSNINAFLFVQNSFFLRRAAPQNNGPDNIVFYNRHQYSCPSVCSVFYSAPTPVVTVICSLYVFMKLQICSSGHTFV